MVAASGTKHPTLYAGRQVPFHELEWQDFERFVRTVLIKLGPRLNVSDFALSAGAGDGGFDVFGKCADGTLAIFQCKRLTSKAVGLALAGEELAKVALSSSVEGSRITRHFIITCGSVGEELRSVLRSKDRTQLVSWARQKTSDGPPEVKALAAKVQAAGRDPTTVVDAYVRGIADIVVWSGADLDAEMATISSALADEFDRFFVVSPVLKEHPRPDLDEDAYLKAILQPAVNASELHVVRVDAPPNLFTHSRARPRVPTPAPTSQSTTRRVSSLFLETRPREALALAGDGGAGKTTAIHLAEVALASSRLADRSKSMPVVVNGKSYTGNLDKLVHARLGVTHGSWRSLAGPVFIVIDGIDEIAPQHLPTLEEEIDDLPWDRTSLGLSLRRSGLRSPLVITRLAHVHRLLAPSPHLARRIAATVLPQERVTPFFDALYLQTANRRDVLLDVPFGVILAAEVFRATGALPSSRSGLIHAFVDARIARNRETARATLGSLSETPTATLTELAGEVAFQFMLLRDARELEEGPALAAIADAMKTCRARGVFGADDIRVLDVPSMLVHFEFLVRTANGFALPHDVIAGYLASRGLAAAWRSWEHDAGSRFEDAWAFATVHVPTAERLDFVGAVARVNLVVAADCAREAGDAERKLVQEFAVADLTAKTLKRRRAAIALGRLGSDAALQALRDVLPKDREDDREMFHDIAGPLIAAGDEALASAMLEAADKMSSMPGVTFSGGEAALWELAPSELALKLARQRVDEAANAPRIFLSLDTIGAFGDASDVDRLTRLSEHDELYVVGHALRSLDHVAHASSIAATEKAWGRCTYAAKALIAELYTKIVGKPDLEWCLSVLEATTPFEADDPGLEHRIRAAASAGVQAAALSPPDLARLLNAFSTRCAANAPWLWSALSGRGIDQVDAEAMHAITTPVPDEVGFACNYVSRTQHWDDDRLRGFRSAVVTWIDGDPLRAATWHGHRALEFLIGAGGCADAARAVERAWRKLYETGVAIDTPMEMHELLQFAGDVADNLDHEMLLAILSFDDGALSASVRDVRRKLAALATNEEIDAILAASYSPADFLAVLSNGPIRESLADSLRATLKAAVPYDHAALASLAVAIRAWYSDEVLSIVVDVLASAECGHGDAKFFLQDVANAVGTKITRDQFVQFVQPRQSAIKDEVVFGIFDWWDQVSAAHG